MKFLYTVIFISLITSCHFFPQSQSGKKFHAYSGTMVLTAEGGITLAYTDYKGNDFDYLGKASVEYFFPTNSLGAFGLRVFSGGGFIAEQDAAKIPDYFRTQLNFLGTGIVYTLSLGNSVFPYSFAGLSYLWFDPHGRNNVRLENNSRGNYKRNEINLNGEIGLRILIAENLSFNINGALYVSPNDNLDDIKAGEKTDLFYSINAGFSFSFFNKKDSDGDGVEDDKDMCPDTPIGIQTDEFGCPIDSDKDGVPDYLDQCLDTPFGVKVDMYGCPLDSDGDLVKDYLDLCPNTPPGVKVDKSGCPLDSDNDGVPDYLDKCSNTPSDVVVNKDGCPLDSDLDGIPDYLDQCQNTPAGDQVDEYGCSLVKEMVLTAGTNFAFNSSELLSSAYPELDKLIEIIKRNPESRWRIEGHTDSKGTADVNKRISRERAESVLNYFISKGLNKNRFEIVGFGEDYPIADNSTEEGRAKNRRVAIIRVD